MKSFLKKFVDIYQSNCGTILAHPAVPLLLCNLNCIHIDANIFRGHFTIWGGWVDRGGVRPNHCTNENARETRADLKQCKIHSVPFSEFTFHSLPTETANTNV